MGSNPAVKGSLIAGTIERAQKLLEEGRLSPQQLAARLSAEELEELERPVNLSGWYDLGFYQRLAELMCEVHGEDPSEYFSQQGRERAQRLIDSGLYQQMEYLGRTQVSQGADAQSRFEAYGRDLKLLVTLSTSILNFSRWSVEVDPEHADRYQIRVSEAETYPEFLAWGTQGFINAMASNHGLGDVWYYERIAPSVIAFRMRHAL